MFDDWIKRMSNLTRSPNKITLVAKDFTAVDVCDD